MEEQLALLMYWDLLRLYVEDIIEEHRGNSYKLLSRYDEALTKMIKHVELL